MADSSFHNDPSLDPERDRSRKNNLPVWIQVFLERVVPYERRDVVVGDFAEAYRSLRFQKSPSYAFWWTIGQLLASVPSFLTNGLTLGSSMISNYLTTARRNILKRKFYAGLNIGGLALGMAICLLILQYVAFEYSFDSFHAQRENVYRVNMKTFRGGEQTTYDAYTFWALGPAVVESAPSVAEAARLHPAYGTATIRTVENEPQVFKTTDLAYADPSFFRVFSFPDITGNAFRALSTRGGVVLSRSAAERYFGTVDVVGQELEIYSWTDATFTVRAVIEDMPPNSHLDLGVILSVEDLLLGQDSQYADTDGWGWTNFVTYVQLHPDAEVDTATRQVGEVIASGLEEEWEESSARNEPVLQPLEDIHLFSEFTDEFSAGSAYKTVVFLSIIGLFVLIVAWLNYINLTTARAVERAREVGVRKASGARRSQIVTQFLVESILINAVALALAILIATQALPVLNRLVGAEIPSTIWRSSTVWGALLLLLGIGSVLASFYPAVIVSSYQPAMVLKGIISRPGRNRFLSGAGLKKSLIVFQFAISIALLSGTYIVSKQVEHLQDVDLGFELDQVLILQRPSLMGDDAENTRTQNAFLAELETLSSVSHVVTSTSVPGQGFSLGTSARKESDEPVDGISINAFWAGDGFFDTYGISLLAGRFVSSSREADVEDGVMINQTAVDRFGLGTPAYAIGRRVVVGSSSVFQIVGVTEDFSWMSAKAATEPVFVFPSASGSNYSMKVISSEVGATLEQIETLYHQFFPGNPFDYAFANSSFDVLYKAEERLGTLVRIFASFALLVAILGLVGLAALTASQRTTEIGIRKALGAGSWSIARLLTGQFVLLVMIGLLVAVPVIWLVADRWLDNFATRIALTPDLFLLPGLVVLAAAIGASLYHVSRAARMNPVKGIRSN